MSESIEYLVDEDYRPYRRLTPVALALLVAVITLLGLSAIEFWQLHSIRTMIGDYQKATQSRQEALEKEIKKLEDLIGSMPKAAPSESATAPSAVQNPRKKTK